MGVGHQDDQRFVRQGHGKAGNGILVEALVAVAQRLTGSDLEPVVDKGSLTVGITYYSINNNNIKKTNNKLIKKISRPHRVR